jgi:hypothetical protein
MTSEGRLAQKGPACYIRSLTPALWALGSALGFIWTDRRIGLPATLGPGS